ncbi:hypothetical protein [Bacillus sp. T33-2]|uniref:hypothetical protein n=1 Tax=Bacillus sp. T33-2 TaxID=2054168 RepID=UPI000C75D68D|nr:hypothetical protein [Bacillus sp. T33-2]PLR98132.1 hypothetical protein CVD19_05895 [Bacillus sp. T33-2]
MNHNRYLLCLLICAMLLYFGVPKLNVLAPGKEGLFAAAWLLLAFLSAAGNLAAFLYAPKSRKVPLDRQPHLKERKVPRGYGN